MSKRDDESYFKIIKFQLTNTPYSSVSQPVGRGPLVGHRDLLVGHQIFIILFQTLISYTIFINFIKDNPISYISIKKKQNKSILVP